MDITEMNAAFEAAKLEVRKAEIVLQDNATLMATLLGGLLRHVKIPPYNWRDDPLAILKRELQGYNTKTRKWGGS